MTNPQMIGPSCLACSHAEMCGSCARRIDAGGSTVGRVGRLQFVVVDRKRSHNNMHFGVRHRSYVGTAETDMQALQTAADDCDQLSIENSQPDLSLAASIANLFEAEFAWQGYKIENVVALTNSSLVIKATADWFQGALAFKFFLPSLLESRFAQRIFAQEASVLSQINHPNIAPLYRCGVTFGGVPYLASQFVPGSSLFDLNRGGKSLEPLSLFVPICEGLAFAHSQNIIHGRLSATKIIASSAQEHSFVPKIIDFSVCAALRLQLPFNISSLRVSASPEERYGQDPDFRSDIYSFGHVMYEILTGSRPAFNKGKQVIGFSQLRGVAKMLEPLVVRCLAHEPADRYQSTAELLEDLRAVESKLDQF